MPAFCAAAASAFSFAGLTSCSDWTAPESVGIHVPTVEEEAPEQYGQYLRQLNEYKQGEHKVVMAFISNVKGEAPESQSMRLEAYPDSIDVLCLAEAENLHSDYVSAIGEVQRKGTAVYYEIDFSSIEEKWQQFSQDTPAAVSFPDYCKENVSALVGLCNMHGFDGITVTYDSPAPSAVSDADAERIEGGLAALFAEISSWKTSNPDKGLIFSGFPQYLPDTSVLEECDYIVVNARDAVSEADLDISVRKALSAGVPLDNVIICVAAYVPGTTSGEGWFEAGVDGNTIDAVAGAAEWVMTGDSFTKAGLAVADAQNDYYNSNASVFSKIRKAIQTMNSIR